MSGISIEPYFHPINSPLQNRNFGAYPEPFRQSGFTIDPYGQKIQIHISHDSHTSQKIEVCINIQILAKECVSLPLYIWPWANQIKLHT